MKRRKQTESQLAKETVELIQFNPVSAGERYYAELNMEVDRRLQAVNGAVGEESITSALLAAYYAFGHALAEATQRRGYETHLTLAERMPTDFLKRRLQGLRHSGSLPPVAIPAIGRKILEAIEAQQGPKPGPKVFQGENEWQEYLRQRGLVEVDPDPYVSRTKSPRRPSPE